MKILLFCATERGKIFAEKIFKLVPEAKFTVCVFREEPQEPLFFESIKKIVLDNGSDFIDYKNIESINFADFDFLFVVSWRFLIKKIDYEKIKNGCFVFHDSLLPKYRGFSPVPWAIINGEKEIGVSLFKIDEEIDSGDIIDQIAITILDNEYIDTIIKKITMLYISLLEKNIYSILSNKYICKKQNNNIATYCCKRIIDDYKINWESSQIEILNFIRATSYPYQGAYCFLKDEKFIIWTAAKFENIKYIGNISGRIVKIVKDIGIVVLTKDYPILLKKVQFRGKISTADNFIKSLSATLI